MTPKATQPHIWPSSHVPTLFQLKRDIVGKKHIKSPSPLESHGDVRYTSCTCGFAGTGWQSWPQPTQGTHMVPYSQWATAYTVGFLGLHTWKSSLHLEELINAKCLKRLLALRKRLLNVHYYDHCSYDLVMLEIPSTGQSLIASNTRSCVRENSSLAVSPWASHFVSEPDFPRLRGSWWPPSCDTLSMTHKLCHSLWGIIHQFLHSFIHWTNIYWAPTLCQALY